MEADLVIQDGLVIPGWELWVTASRSGGPGGQHANKTSSRVSLHWNLVGSTALREFQRARLMGRLRNRLGQDGVLKVTVDDARSQHRNREIARERLVDVIRRGLVVQRTRVATRPTRSSQRRRVDSKKRRGQVKRMRRSPSDD